MANKIVQEVSEQAVRSAARVVAQEMNGREDNGWRQGKPIEDPEKMKRWGFITAKPSEYLVHMRKGLVIPRTSGQGATCFKWPWDSVAVIPTTLQRLYFSADQITAEKVGVQVKGLAVFRVARPELAVRMLNFSFPERAQEKLGETLRDMFIGAVRRLVANLTVEECLTKRKESLASFLLAEIAPVVEGSGKVTDSTDRGWGVVIDTIEIQDVVVLSDSVFKNMQAPYRNALLLKARESEITREKETLVREAAGKKEIEEARAVTEAQMRELKAQTETAAAQTEHTEEMKRLAIRAEAEVAKVQREKEGETLKLQKDADMAKARAEKEREAIAVKAESEAQARQVKAQKETAAATAEQAEGMKRMLLATELEKAKITREREAELMRLAKDAELARARAETEREAQAMAVETESRARQAKAQGETAAAETEIDAYQKQEALKTQAEHARLVQARALEQLKVAHEAEAAREQAAAAHETAFAQDALAAERAARSRELKAADATAQAEVRRLEMEVARVEGELKAALAARQKEIENDISAEKVQSDFVNKTLPEIARSFQQKFGEVKIIATGDQNPFGFLVHAFDGVMEIAKKSGLQGAMASAIVPTAQAVLRNGMKPNAAAKEDAATGNDAV